MRKKKKKTRQIYVALLTSFSQEPKCQSTLFLFWHGFKRLRSDGYSFQKLGQRLHGFVPLDFAVVDCTVEALGPDNDWRAGRERGRSLLTPSQVYFGYCGRHYTTGGLVIPRYRCPVEVAILPNPDPRRKKQKTLSRPVRYVTLAPLPSFQLGKCEKKVTPFASYILLFLAQNPRPCPFGKQCLLYVKFLLTCLVA